MSALKLYYFDMAGRAEPIRMTLTLGKVAFEDIRLSQEEFGKLKQEGKFPLGQVPCLEIDGKMLPQSTAILRFAGRKAGFYPDDPLLAAKVDAAIDAGNDIVPKVVAVLFGPEEGKAAAIKALTEFAPTYFKNMENLLKANTSQKYIAGDKPTIADCLSFTFAVGFLYEKENPMAPILREALETAPITKAYLEGLVNVEFKDYKDTAPSYNKKK